jgi:hypothetical protein
MEESNPSSSDDSISSSTFSIARSSNPNPIAVDISIWENKSDINVEVDVADLYDYCMVLPVGSDGSYDHNGAHYLSKLREYGFEIFPFMGIKKTEIFVLLRVPIHVLKMFADSINFILPLDPKAVGEAALKGDSSRNIAGFEIGTNEDVTKYNPYDYIYGN